MTTDLATTTTDTTTTAAPEPRGIRLQYGKGYMGKLRHRCWVAELTGTDKRYHYARTFLDPDRVESKHPGRSRTMVHFEFSLQPDRLYQISEAGESWVVMTYTDSKTNRVLSARLSEARLQAWLAALDSGATGREARLSTKGL